ncbi:MAG: cell envelope integrity protein CreD [Oleispira sp.]|nr:cell envelope integrity protein CreD [Oleispira sp.]MBL4879879.1 cell envelope integrity protein CreD [Oleispira sp.]
MNKTLLIKSAVIAVIGIILLLVLESVSSTIWERKNYQSIAKNSVAKSWTGAQNVFGPILVVPYSIKWSWEEWSDDGKRKILRHKSRKGKKYILPSVTQLQANIATDIRYQGIYQFPVYSTDLNISGNFSAESIAEQVQVTLPNRSAKLTYAQPYIAVAVSDARGINSIPVLKWSTKEYVFKAGSQLAFMDSGIHAPLPTDLLQSINKSTSKAANKGQLFPFSLNLSLRGMDEIKFYATALNYQLSLNSPWQHPKFSGDFLPLSRTVTDQGFDAKWEVSSFASNMEEKIALCEKQQCEEVLKGSFGVEFIEPVNVYLQTERSLKYGFLFIVLIFVAFFLFEILKKLPIHPIQYGLVGFAIALFYLLLLSLSEHLSFMLSYFIAAFGSVTLISFYLVNVLKNTKTAAMFGGLLTLLYFTLYIIVSAEDFALLMGSSLVFIVLAVVMMTTRNIDWYQVNAVERQ